MCRSTRSICGSSSTASIFFLSSIANGRKIENESGSLCSRIYPYLAAVRFDDASHDRKSHSHSLLLPVGIFTLIKSLEHRLAFSRWNSRPLVFDGKSDLSTGTFRRDRDGGPGVGIFCRIV